MFRTAIAALWMTMVGVAVAQQAPDPENATAKSAAALAALQAKYDDFANLAKYRADDAALPADQPGRVVFFGDSLTEGWGRNGTEFFPGKPYVNRGISGQTTPQMLIRFRQDVVALHPETVVILAGTNDIAGNTGPSTLEMTENNLEDMVEIARANGIRVVLCSLLPARDFWWHHGLEPADKIRAQNVWIAAYARAQKLVYVDYYTPMATPDGGMKPELSGDGVHPNAAGYAIMAPLAEEGIKQAKHEKLKDR